MFIKNETNFEMKTRSLMSTLLFSIVPVQNNTAVSNSFGSYLIGGIVALIILVYLIYTLLHPEKF